jgi:uncharacterized membrane protein YdbT with pleckstrin-like domain
MIFFTTWKVTEDNIQIIRGVFYKKTDYIELYRVVDYQETQTLIQQLLRNKTVRVHSGDRTTPILLLYGIDYNIRLVDQLRERVEMQKKKHGIYEVTNRGY